MEIIQKQLYSYIAKAMIGAGVGSDRSLSEALGLNPTAINQWRKRNGLPSDEVMVKLCLFANIDPIIGLMDLNVWRTDGMARDYYFKFKRAFEKAEKEIKKEAGKVASFALCFIMLILATPANADTPKQNSYVNEKILYIMENNGLI